MTKPVVILDPHWRSMGELFAPADLFRLLGICHLRWARDAPMPQADLDAAALHADVLIAATPNVDAAILDQAPKLRAIIEVSGGFPGTIDYATCFAREVEVFSCAPGFRQSVAEMGLAMALAGARGMVTEHEAFRRGEESWLQDNALTDFSLFGADVGFIGFGQIAQEMTRLLAPFRAKISAFDPWISPQVADKHGIQLASLDAVLQQSRCLFVTAVPTHENLGMLDSHRLSMLQDHALLVLLSRAHLVDFDAVVAEAASGRLRVATDVFPTEPLDASHYARELPNMILSPHRAAAVAGGRHLIGEMIVDDLIAMKTGNSVRRLTRASPDRIAELAGAGNAQQVSDMAAERP